MSERPSKSAINKLGERLRNGDESEEALRLLDAYREIFIPPAREIVPQIESIAGSVSERVGKTTQAIVAKLQRQKHLQLAQMQDIAGARVIVSDVTRQNELVTKVRAVFPDVKHDDKRSGTGYRAVHIIIRHQNLPFELQIRTTGQHIWAEASEALAARYGIELKYGGGSEAARLWLGNLSKVIAELDTAVDYFERADLRDKPMHKQTINELMKRFEKLVDQPLHPGEDE